MKTYFGDSLRSSKFGSRYVPNVPVISPDFGGISSTPKYILQLGPQSAARVPTGEEGVNGDPENEHKVIQCDLLCVCPMAVTWEQVLQTVLLGRDIKELEILCSTPVAAYCNSHQAQLVFACSWERLYSERLLQDAPYLTSYGRLSEHLVDKIILQLNRVYPQILSNKEAEKFRNPKTPVHLRLSDLLKHLQRRGDLSCQEFYRALRNNADRLYYALPSRSNTAKSPDHVDRMTNQEKVILNDRGPVFFLACFSMAAGLACLMYYSNPEVKSTAASRKVFGFTAVGFGRHIKNILVTYLDEVSLNN
ncbi:caspase recruitment domain-containing protein 19 [Pelodytes ibericus]